MRWDIRGGISPAGARNLASVAAQVTVSEYCASGYSSPKPGSEGLL